MSLFEFNNHFQHNLIVENFAERNGVSLEQAKKVISEMSFSEYHKLSEAGANIVPPSGQTIAPSGPLQQKAPAAQGGPQQVKSIWPGKGSPVEVGMTVGLKGPNGLPVPGTISQVDAGAKGVKVKNPTTGQEEWANMDTLEPFMAQNQQESVPQQNDIQRLRELAGIKENCSSGATGAGAIAIAPAAMGKVKRRQETSEQAPVEYTPKEAPKTIVGDTKPNQASGKLSADLAARGKKTASRINNGRKR